MSSITAVVEIGFCCAHRLDIDMGRCSTLHGHNYRLEIEVSSMIPENGPSGSIADFKRIKEVAKDWIDSHWDHAVILKNTDPLGPILREANQQVFTMSRWPTAEAKAKFLLTCIMPEIMEHEFGDEIRVESITLWETEKSHVKARRC